jgi:hypothetical protein
MKKFLCVLSIIFLSLLFVRQVNAATLNLVADKDTYKVGDTFDVNVKIDSENVGINGAQATIKFDGTLLKATGFSKTGSIFDFWLTDPTISANQVSFIAASTAGYNGKSLQVLKITFQVKGAGTENFVLGDAAITTADGSGSNVLSQSNNLTLTLVSSIGKTTPNQITRAPVFANGSPAQPAISVPLYPDSTKWNNVSTNFFANWKLPPDVSDVAMVLDKFPGTMPTQSEGLFESKQFSSLADGIYYVHARYKNNIGWGPVEHYKIATDTTPPSKFSIVFPNGQPTDSPMPAIVFNSTDALSGINRYEISIDNNPPLVVSSNSYTLPLQIPGKHLLKISAYDNAGNATQSITNYEIISIAMPTITTVNKNVFSGEGGFFISGTAGNKFKVRVILKDQSGNIAFTDLKMPDVKGYWSASIDTPLKKQTYQFEIATIDDRGAVSTIVKSDFISVRDRPVLSIGSLEITATWFFILFVLIVLGAFLLGWASVRFAKKERNLESIMAERDIENVFNMFGKDIKTILSKYTDKGLEPTGAMETKVLLERLLSQLEKMKDYTKQDVTDINIQRHFLPSLIKRIKDLLHINS